MSSRSSRIGLDFERSFWRRGMSLVAGIDEAGRGPLAGPVVAAAVVFSEDIDEFPYLHPLRRVDDSKILPADRREELYEIICNHAAGVGIGRTDHHAIDEVNILNATFRAMHEAVGNLTLVPHHLLIDGPHFAGANIPFTTIVDGDAQSLSIAAASIIAKVTRDRMMIQFDEEYPLYGFAKHKGYATKEHLEAIRKHGLCEIHRRSFRSHAGLVYGG